MQNTDELSGLVASARAGDQDAIAALYEKTYSQVFYTVKSMIKDEDAVFDILQDSYIKAFAHLEGFAGDTKFLPWVKQIAANTARDWLKKKKPTLFAELDSGDGTDTAPEERFVDERSENLPEQVMDQDETKRLVREIIDQLPEDQRAVIGMFYYEELSVKEIAEAMGSTESAVKSRLMYGRKKIENKVLDLERRGTKLYGLAPIPFLLWLFKGQKAYAAELPSSAILETVLDAAQAGTAAGTAGTAASGAAGTAAAASASTAATTAGAAASGGLALKAVLVGLLSAAVIGGGAFGVASLIGDREEAPEPEYVETVDTDTPANESEDAALQSAEEPDAAAEDETSVLERAMEQYTAVLQQAHTYFVDNDPARTYLYALVQMQPDDPVPTLLLRLEADPGLDTTYGVRLFHYVPMGDTLLQPERILCGSFSGSAYRGGLSLQADGDGLMLTEWSPGTGEAWINRVTLGGISILTGDIIRMEVQWEGRIDMVPVEYQGIPIQWQDISEWGAAPAEEDISAAEPAPAEVPLPEDGDRIVFRGTIDSYTYEELLELPNQVDYNGGYQAGETFRIIILDEPMTMYLFQPGMGPEPVQGTVAMVDVTRAEGLDRFDGQYLIFSIDQENTWYPGDTSLPLGVPRTDDVHVLQ